MLDTKMQDDSINTNNYDQIVCIGPQYQISNVAAQLAGICSILSALRFQIDNGSKITGDSMFALEMFTHSLNVELCGIADLISTLA